MTATSTAQTPTAAPQDVTRRTRLLIADAVVSTPAGLALAASAPWLDGTLGAPSSLLVALGAVFLVYAAALMVLARMGASRPAVLTVAAGNLSWAVLTAVVLAAGAVSLTAAGAVVAVAMAAFTAVIGLLQYRAAR